MGYLFIKVLDLIQYLKINFFFIYLNNKQNSKDEIIKYSKINKEKEKCIFQINKITKEIILCEDIYIFSQLIDSHESIVSDFLEIKTIKEKLFKDFKGTVKSLGAWGGDFILAIGDKDYIIDYFKSKNYFTIFSYSDIIV